MGMFCITRLGMGCLETTQTFNTPCLLLQYRLHKLSTSRKIADMVTQLVTLSAFELMQELGHQGWTSEMKQPSKKIESYKAGANKLWYFANSISIPYLQCLLLSQSLFDSGLRELHHFQPVQYYKTLIYFLQHVPERLNDVIPNQALPFYKLLRQRKGRVDTQLELDEERGKAGGYGPWRVSGECGELSGEIDNDTCHMTELKFCVRVVVRLKILQQH